MEAEINEELITKVARILIGPVSPAADSAIDDKRMENLRTMCNVTYKLLQDINSVAQLTDSQFASVKRMAEYARNFIQDMKEIDNPS